MISFKITMNSTGVMNNIDYISPCLGSFKQGYKNL